MEAILNDSLKISLLGIVQGLTEFLPISSSGHLAIIKHFLKFYTNSLSIDIFLHFGSLIAMFIFFFKDIKEILFFKDKDNSIKILSYIIIGIIPAGLAGLLFQHKIEILFSRIENVGFAYYICAIILITTLFKKNNEMIESLSIKKAIIIGLWQIIALVPGISRSGTTIATALLLNIKPETAGKFSFFMAIPLIAGAVGKDLIDTHIESSFLIPLIIGVIVSAIASYLSLRLLFFILQKKRFGLFGIYCLMLSIIIFIFC